MSILNSNNVASFVKEHEAKVEQFYKNMRMQFNRLAADVWNNKTYTATEIVAAYGEDAAELFRLSGIMAEMINAATGETLSIVPAKYSFVINNDGTVTLTEIASSSSSAS